MKPYNLFAVVQPGLEQIAGEELMRNGINQLEPVRGGFSFAGHLSTLIRLNLRLRTVSRILVRFAEFSAKSFGELARKVEHLPWDECLTNQQPDIRVVSFRSKLYHETAITNRLQRILGNAGKDAPRQRVLVRIEEDLVQISLDSGGENLHKRGYADWKGPAPLRETVAAAMLFAAEWDGQPLVDPMCGSGTIPLEAWGLNCGIPTYRLRDFSFKYWKSFDPAQWNRYLDEPATDSGLRIHGYDIDPEMIEVARHNAERMGAKINFAARDIRRLSLLEPSWVMVNPPYGKRLEDEQTGYDALARLQTEGHRVFVLTTGDLLRTLRLPWNTLLRFKNGGISVTWAEIGAEPRSVE
jgi:putative N6-adenine-specific DNA methylase